MPYTDEDILKWIDEVKTAQNKEKSNELWLDVLTNEFGAIQGSQDKTICSDILRLLLKEISGNNNIAKLMLTKLYLTGWQHWLELDVVAATEIFKSITDDPQLFLTDDTRKKFYVKLKEEIKTSLIHDLNQKFVKYPEDLFDCGVRLLKPEDGKRKSVYLLLKDAIKELLLNDLQTQLGEYPESLIGWKTLYQQKFEEYQESLIDWETLIQKKLEKNPEDIIALEKIKQKKFNSVALDQLRKKISTYDPAGLINLKKLWQKKLKEEPKNLADWEASILRDLEENPSGDLVGLTEKVRNKLGYNGWNSYHGVHWTTYILNKLEENSEDLVGLKDLIEEQLRRYPIQHSFIFERRATQFDDKKTKNLSLSPIYFSQNNYTERAYFLTLDAIIDNTTGEHKVIKIIQNKKSYERMYNKILKLSGFNRELPIISIPYSSASLDSPYGSITLPGYKNHVKMWNCFQEILSDNIKANKQNEVNRIIQKALVDLVQIRILNGFDYLYFNELSKLIEIIDDYDICLKFDRNLLNNILGVVNQKPFSDENVYTLEMEALKEYICLWGLILQIDKNNQDAKTFFDVYGSRIHRRCLPTTFHEEFHFINAGLLLSPFYYKPFFEKIILKNNGFSNFFYKINFSFFDRGIQTFWPKEGNPCHPDKYDCSDYGREVQRGIFYFNAGDFAKALTYCSTNWSRTTDGFKQTVLICSDVQKLQQVTDINILLQAIDCLNYPEVGWFQPKEMFYDQCDIAELKKAKHNLYDRVMQVLCQSGNYQNFKKVVEENNVVYTPEKKPYASFSTYSKHYDIILKPIYEFITEEIRKDNFDAKMTLANFYLLGCRDYVKQNVPKALDIFRKSVPYKQDYEKIIPLALELCSAFLEQPIPTLWQFYQAYPHDRETLICFVDYFTTLFEKNTLPEAATSNYLKNWEHTTFNQYEALIKRSKELISYYYEKDKGITRKLACLSLLFTSNDHQKLYNTLADIAPYFTGLDLLTINTEQPIRQAKKCVLEKLLWDIRLVENGSSQEKKSVENIAYSDVHFKF